MILFGVRSISIISRNYIRIIGFEVRNFTGSGTTYLSASGSNNSAVAVDNNLYFGASASKPGDWSDAHAKYADPLLINAPTDMHIRSSSPAKNSGALLDTAIIGTLDIDNQPRVIDGAIDIGADEIGTTAVAPSDNCLYNHRRSGAFMSAMPKTIMLFGSPQNTSAAMNIFSIDGKYWNRSLKHAPAIVIYRECSIPNKRKAR